MNIYLFTFIFICFINPFTYPLIYRTIFPIVIYPTTNLVIIIYLSIHQFLFQFIYLYRYVGYPLPSWTSVAQHTEQTRISSLFNIQTVLIEDKSNRHILLLGCCTSFPCTLIKWYLQLDKKNCTPIYLLYPIPRQWMINLYTFPMMINKIHLQINVY